MNLLHPMGHVSHAYYIIWGTYLACVMWGGLFLYALAIPYYHFTTPFDFEPVEEDDLGPPLRAAQGGRDGGTKKANQGSTLPLLRFFLSTITTLLTFPFFRQYTTSWWTSIK